MMEKRKLIIIIMLNIGEITDIIARIIIMPIIEISTARIMNRVISRLSIIVSIRVN